MPFHNLSATDLHELFRTKKASAVEISRFFVSKSVSHNPALNAFVEIYEKGALATAQKLDADLAAGLPIGKLAAVPVVLKDNILFKGETVSAGSKMLAHYKATFHATVAEKLLAAGAVILGRANCDEFAMGSSTENSAFGPTRNPWDLSKTPGGSSGGSAAVVAAGMAPLSLGSDTGGSIRQPASLCGLVGMKPTYGMISRYGLIAFASSLDQIGPFARSVQDAALLLEVLSGHDPKDATSLQKNFQTPSFKPGFLRGRKIGVDRSQLEGLDPEVRAIFEETCKLAMSEGASIVDVEMKLHKHALSVYYILAPAEASSNLARYDGVGFSTRCQDPKNLLDLYERSRSEGFGKEVKRRILMGTFVLSSGYSSAYYQQAMRVRSMIIAEFKEIFKQVDMLLSPTSPTEAFDLGAIQAPLAMYMNDIFTIPANLAGLPAISFPRGLSKKGLPIGMHLSGPQYSDTTLLEAAFALEHPELKNRVAGAFHV